MSPFETFLWSSWQRRFFTGEVSDWLKSNAFALQRINDNKISLFVFLSDRISVSQDAHSFFHFYVWYPGMVCMLWLISYLLEVPAPGKSLKILFATFSHATMAACLKGFRWLPCSHPKVSSDPTAITWFVSGSTITAALQTCPDSRFRRACTKAKVKTKTKKINQVPETYKYTHTHTHTINQTNTQHT